MKTNAKLPAAKSTDGSGERGARTANGVGMGRADATGRANGGKEKGEYNTGRSDKSCYTHGRRSQQ